MNANTKLFRVSTLVLILFSGCEEKATAPDQSETSSIEKSAKRGLAYNLTNPADFDTLKTGISWWYNWHHDTDAPDNYYTEYQMEFIPMLWGGNTSQNDINKLLSYILDHPELKYLLVMNEPNLIDQANRTPEQAVTDWITYEQVIDYLALQGRTVYLVGPAMNWGTMSAYWDPVVWLDAFFSAYNSQYGKDPIIDYLAFHWYDYGLEAQLDRLTKYGKPIWITEMANWNAQINSYDKQIEQMQEMVAICERREDVFRYAWFIGRGDLPDDQFTYLLEPEYGDLTDLGYIYLNLPYSK